MKTRTHIPLLTLIGLFAMSCTSSLQVSNTSSWNDEIYGASPKPQTSQLAVNENIKNTPEKKVDSDLNKLEQKYSDVLEINMDSIKNDTLIYKAEETNPYKRILSDSYEDSYERRLNGFKDPKYGIENWTVYHSDDWFYAQAYDPAFYNIIVMGDQIWVEPRYISLSFGWPHSHLYYGFGWNYSYWNSYYSWNWGWSYPYNYYNPYAYNPWYNNSYWSGWNDGYWYGNNNNTNYYYGRRSSGTTDYSVTRRGANGNIQTTENQTIYTGRRRGGTNENSANAIVSTRRTQTRVTPTYESTSRREGSSTDQAVATRRGGSNRTDGSITRTDRPTREIGITEPTRRTYNPTYERSRTTGGESTRRTERTFNNGNSITRQPSTTSRTSTTPTYNRPSRVSTPSTTSGGNDSYRTRSSETRSSSGSGSTYSPSRSSSSSSSKESTRSTSNSSSGSSSGSRRR